VAIATDVPTIDGDLAISIVTLAELHVGVLVTHDPMRRAERLRRLTSIERWFDPLPVDDRVAAVVRSGPAAIAS